MADKINLAEALRKLAGALEVYHVLEDDRGYIIVFWIHDPQELRLLLHSLRSLGQVEKREFGVNGEVEGLEFSITLGPLKVEVDITKKSLGCVKVKVMREVEEWQCPDSIVETVLQDVAAQQEDS